MSTSSPLTSHWRHPLVMIGAACLIALISNGSRQTFGFFLEPMTQANGWTRETFSLAMAIQNLAWGALVPIAGAIADRRGAAPVLAFGSICYALGYWGMMYSESSFILHMTGGILVGIAVAFASFAIAMSVIARVVSPEKRTLAMGLGMACGSLGTVIYSPITVGLIESIGWQYAGTWIGMASLIVLPLVFLLPSRKEAPLPAEEDPLTIKEAIGEAGRHRGYVLLVTGFFVCGFHVAFIAVHFPAYVTDVGLSPETAGYALAIVGLVNIAGSFSAGVLGQKFAMKNCLSVIYFGRAIAITGLLLAPKTDTTILVFAFFMGMLWLSTIPLTSGIVARVFGVQYLGMLFGFALFSHQVGSFLGVWLGGVLFDKTGSYDAIWWAGVVLGVMAAIIHIPINEKPVSRLTAAAKP